MYCMKCGAELSQGDKFCLKCGTSVGSGSANEAESGQILTQYDENWRDAFGTSGSGQTTGGKSTGTITAERIYPTVNGNPGPNRIHTGERTPVNGYTGNAGGNVTGRNPSGKGMGAGTKALLILAAVIALLGLGFGVFCIVQSFRDPYTQKTGSVSPARQTASGGRSEDGKVAVDGTEEQTSSEQNEAAMSYAVAEDVTASDLEDGDFQPRDYSRELTEDQKLKLYSVLSSISGVLVPDRSMWDNDISAKTYCDMKRISIDPGYDLGDVAYSIAISPGFCNQFQLKNDYKWVSSGEVYNTQVRVVPEKDLETILKESLDLGLPDSAVIKDHGLLHYENGNYLALIWEGDWVSGYTGLLKIWQTGQDEITINGVVGFGHIHNYYENDYDPHKWTLSFDSGVDDATSLYHTYTAKARINPASPCGLTIVGLVYDDLESATVTRDEGFEVSYDRGQDLDLIRDPDTYGYYILPNSSMERISKSDIADLTDEELRLARNEIYARHGRKFNDRELQAYFDKQPWYYGIIDPDDFTDNMLSDIERENAKLLLEEEKRRKKTSR